jgi:hypothetical protein
MKSIVITFVVTLVTLLLLFDDGVQSIPSADTVAAMAAFSRALHFPFNWNSSSNPCTCKSNAQSSLSQQAEKSS